MSSAALRSPHIVLADLIPGARVRDAALVVGGAGLTGLAAQVSIHTSLSPVPFTLQTLAVLTVGAALGTVRGLLSLLLYMLAGLAGVPWYANHTSGWGGPSFGYILGFVVAAGVVGFLAERRADRNVFTMIALMLIGNVVIYAIGASWLAANLHVGAATAFRLGVRPFLISDAAKTALAAIALPTVWKFVRR
jgi:biotin transport system substrate-specific component